METTDGLRELPSPTAVSLAAQVARTLGASVEAVLHYGSRAQGRASRPDSAFDFFVVVTDYKAAYRAAATTAGPRRRPRLAVVLAKLLPPNAMSIRRDGPTGGEEAKCLIISDRDFRHECSARASDHFVQARMAQTVRLAWARDAASADAILDMIRQARHRSLDWVLIFLPPSFDLMQFCSTMIGVSFAHEIRAEAAAHAEVLTTAQRDLLCAIYSPVLDAAAACGALERQGDRYRQQRPPSRWRQLRVRTYFRWSKVRTTLRLIKHPFLYDNWLEYLMQKIDRSTGQKITLTSRERRHPLIFLWPRVFRYLRTRPQRGPS